MKLGGLIKNINLSRYKKRFAFRRVKRHKVSKGAKIRNRYYHVPHLNQDSNGKVTNSQLDTTNESLNKVPISGKVMYLYCFN